MLNANNLATDIRDALGFSNRPVSDKNKGFTNGLVPHVQTGVVAFAPGTITGTTLIVTPFLTGGQGVGGTIAGLVGSVLASALKMQMQFPNITSKLAQLANTIDAQISAGLVAFTSGEVTATGNTATTNNPGNLLGGAATGGQILGLTGTSLASLLASSMGFPSVSPQLLAFSNALMSYITNNAEVIFAVGFINGVTPNGGGSLTAGTGAGGMIS